MSRASVAIQAAVAAALLVGSPAESGCAQLGGARGQTYRGVATATGARYRTAFAVDGRVVHCGSSKSSGLLLVLGPGCALRADVTQEGGFAVRSNQTCTMDVAGAQIAFSVVAGAGPWPWPGQSGCPSCGPGPGGDPLRLDLAGSVLDATTGSREPIAITLVASSSGPLMREDACAP